MKVIALFNDALRQTAAPETPNFRAMCTPGVSESPDFLEIIAKVKTFDDFNQGNDPHGEHDFGKVTVNAKDYFFKFDYYNQDLTSWSEPMGPNTVHVLTIMRADEY